LEICVVVDLRKNTSLLHSGIFDENCPANHKQRMQDKIVSHLFQHCCKLWSNKPYFLPTTVLQRSSCDPESMMAAHHLFSMIDPCHPPHCHYPPPAAGLVPQGCRCVTPHRLPPRSALSRCLSCNFLGPGWVTRAVPAGRVRGGRRLEVGTNRA
jgi:hypothetical protein